jgi:hypothetical protein
MKKLKFSHPTERLLIFIVVMLISALVAILWYYGERINILWAQAGNETGITNPNETRINTEIRFLIQSALKGLYSHQAVVDPVQKRVYFPEANFYIPLNNKTRDLVYGYSDRDQFGPQSLTITTSKTVNFLPSTFDDVPCLQRHISVNVDSKDNPDGSLMASKKLENGETLYVYRHQEGSCSSVIWSNIYSASGIIAALRQAKSY